MSTIDPKSLTEGRRGVSGLNRWGGHVAEELHRNLQGSRAARVYREMSDNDPVIGATLYLTTSLITGAKWRAEPANPDRPSAVEAAAFLEESIAGLETAWSDVVSDVLSMLTFGWAYLETIYQVDPKTGRLTWRAFEGRAQETLDEWVFDDEGRCVGWWQLAPPNYTRTFLPLAKGLHVRTRKWKDNPEGRSLLRPAYRPWFFLKRIQEIEGIGIDRDLGGLPVLEVPPEIMAPNPTAEQAALRAMAEGIVRGVRVDERAGLVLPSRLDEDGKPTGWKFSLVTSGGRRSIDTNATITRYEQRIAMTLLAQFLLLGMDKVGSFALADNATNLFGLACGSTLDNIEDAFHQQATVPLMELAGIAAADMPRWVHGDIEKPDLGKLATALKDLVGVGIITPDAVLEAAVREVADLPPHDPETAVGAGADMVQPGASGGTDGGTVQGGDAVVFQGLNGAQFRAMLDLMARMSAGQVTAEAAVYAALELGIPEERARRLVTAMADADLEPVAGAGA